MTIYLCVERIELPSEDQLQGGLKYCAAIVVIVVGRSLHCCNIVELKWGILSLSPSSVRVLPNNTLQRFP